MILRSLFSKLSSKDEEILGIVGISILFTLLVSAFIGVGGLILSTHVERGDDGYGHMSPGPYPTGPVLIAIAIAFVVIYSLMPSFFEDCDRKKLGKTYYAPLVIAFAVIFGAYGFQYFAGLSLVTYLVMIVGSVAVAEIIFFADPQKPKGKDNRFWFTAQVKAECYVDVLFGWFIVGSIVGIYNIVAQNAESYGKAIIDTVMVYGIYPVAIVVGALAIYGYIYLNSLKYRKLPKEEPKAETKETEETHEPADFRDCPKCGKLNNVSIRTNCYYCSEPLPNGKKEVES